MTNTALQELANQVIGSYRNRKWRIALAESCTGGLIAGALTAIPGSSAVFERGFVTYSNAAKVDVLGVLPDMLEQFGAVSGETAEAMAQGALEYSLADVALSVTGIAGPDGGTLAKPVGLVYFGLARRDSGTFHLQCHFQGTRDQIRFEAVMEGLRLLESAITE
jgi:nicotinamide-nucleotide amidase